MGNYIISIANPKFLSNFITISKLQAVNSGLHLGSTVLPRQELWSRRILTFGFF